MTSKNATKKILELRDEMTDEELAKTIGITKVTLYNRIRRGNWKKGELCLISNLD